MITYQIGGQGPVISMDPDSLLFVEGLEVEQQTGLGANRYLQELAEGTTQSTAALIWIGAVRTAAARDGVSFRDAARTLPYTGFVESLDLLATMRTVKRQQPDPTEPTAAPDGSPETTSPATSEQPPPPIPSPDGEPPTSESSPSSSASAPGSGIA